MSNPEGDEPPANDNEQIYTVQALTMPRVRSVVRRGNILTITYANGAECRVRKSLIGQRREFRAERSLLAGHPNSWFER